MRWLRKGTLPSDSTLTNKANNTNLVTIKSGNLLYKNDNRVLSNAAEIFYEQPPMTQSTDIALGSHSSRYRDANQKQKNLQEFQNPSTWDRNRDSETEIINI